MQRIIQLFKDHGYDVEELDIIESDAEAIQTMLNTYERLNKQKLTNVTGWLFDDLYDLIVYILAHNNHLL